MLDFGAARDGVPREKRGRRLVVDQFGAEVRTGEEADEDGNGDRFADLDAGADG